jgi:hypothetical protein
MKEFLGKLEALRFESFGNNSHYLVDPAKFSDVLRVFETNPEKKELMAKIREAAGDNYVSLATSASETLRIIEFDNVVHSMLGMNFSQSWELKNKLKRRFEFVGRNTFYLVPVSDFVVEAWDKAKPCNGLLRLQKLYAGCHVAL